MAKRVPKDEPKFNALDASLVRAVVNRSASEQPAASSDNGDRSLPVQEGAVDGSDSPAEPHRAKSVASKPREPDLQKRDREKRVLLTRSEERDIERLVARLAADLETPVKLSHLLRASITMLLHAEEELIERSKRTALSRPGNGNAPELAEFERSLAEILSLAFRQAQPLR